LKFNIDLSYFELEYMLDGDKKDSWQLH